MRHIFITGAVLMATTGMAQDTADQDSALWNSSKAIPTERTRIEIRDELEISVDIPGTLIEVVHLGDVIARGAEVVRLNDSVVQAQYEVAEAQYQEAKERASSDVLVRFAEVKHDTAKAELLEKQEANQRAVDRTGKPVFTLTEMRRAELEVEQGDAEIKKALHDMKVAALAAVTKTAEMQAKDAELKQYTVNSEINGIVTEVLHPAGEAVRQGDPILTITNIEVVKAVLEVKPAYKNRFKVGHKVLVRIRHDTSIADSSDRRRTSDFFTNDKKPAPAQREATLTSSPAEPGAVTFTGEVILIDPRLSTQGDNLEVIADIQNQTDSEGRYLLRDGQKIDAVILDD